MRRQTPSAIVRRLFDARAAGECELVLALLHPDVEAVTLAGGELLRGAAEVRAYLCSEGIDRPRTEVRADDLLEHGDHVDVRGRIRTIGHGRVVDSPAAWTFVVRDGLVVQILPLAEAPAPPVAVRVA